MVGKMVKLKCRVKLDHLVVKPRPKPQGEQETENISDGQDKSSEVILPEPSQMVGKKKAKLKCRVKLDHLVVKPRPKPQGEQETENISDGQDKSSEVILPEPSQLDPVDRTRFYCPDSDIVLKPEEDEAEVDITGSILELEQDEISTPKGSRKGKLPKAPEFPRNPNWLKPEDLLDEMWEKKRVLRSATDNPDQFKFPVDPDIVLSPHVWELPELMALKTELNQTKSSLDHFPLDAWHSHTKRMNIAHLIMSYVKRYFNPEFSSQAWGKMFEILCSYDVIPQKVVDESVAIAEDRKRKQAGHKVLFDSVHLCEAPGAFISALNHFLNISYENIDWKWLATTLNPYHENNDVGKMINDDRLILRSLENWTFLEDKTGNILTIPNLTRLIKDRKEKLDKVRDETPGDSSNNVLLVTADGSIDCQKNPGEQERMVAHLQYGEIIAALKILQKGGSFVLKIFTFLEAVTISHLYLLSCLFKEVHLFKPTTSKEGNSEVYVVCLQYLGKDSIDGILERKLLPSLETYGQLLNEGKLLLPHSAIPDFFILRIKEAAQFFCNYQMKIIKRNASCFPCDTRMYYVMKPFRKEAAEEWIEWSEIKPLPAKLRLFTGEPDDPKMKASHLDIKQEIGCFADKLMRYTGSDLEKLQAIKAELMSYQEWKGAHNHVLYGSVFKVGPIEFERPYTNIRCSRFCYGRILSAREEIRDIVKNYLTDLQAQGLGSMENICSGHTPRRVYESMSKSCDIEMKNLEILCFSKLTWEYVTKSDFQQQKEDLNRLFSAVQEMGRDRSMFLCRFPMLTRLQTGFIFCLASVFEKIIIYGDPEKNVIGIMLHKFKGLTQPCDKNMFRCLADILAVLVDDEFNWPVLQAVPMNVLLEFLPSEFLVRYNKLLIGQDMLRTMNVIECMIRINGKAARKAKAMGEA